MNARTRMDTVLAIAMASTRAPTAATPSPPQFASRRPLTATPGAGAVADCDLEYVIEVRAVKTPEGHVGVGAVVTRDGENAVWEESKYVGQGMSWHVAEYGGLLDAMDAADALGLEFLRASVSSRVVSDQVN